MYVASVAAATAVVGYDLLVGLPWSRSPANRIITGIGYTGSAAIGDSAVDVFVDEVRIGTFYNTRLGMGNKDDIFPQPGNFVPAGALVRVIVTDAPATNPVFLMLDMQEV
jgi:hypothetical protein